MTWALKRQIFYITILVFVFGVFGFLIIYNSSRHVPTCSDGILNGTESGVDCGGSCIRACSFQADSASVIWARSFLVVPGRYNAVAYVENHNKNLAVNKIKYSFRFADKDNVYLGRREGVVFIPPGRAFAVFERGIILGNSTPVYTTFEFTEVPDWITVSQNKINQLKLEVSDISLHDMDTTPRLTATIKNNSLTTIPNVSVVAILYDEKRNALSASSTLLDVLKGEESQALYFTWPLPIPGKVVTTEILPAYNIFTIK